MVFRLPIISTNIDIILVSCFLTDTNIISIFGKVQHLLPAPAPSSKPAARRCCGRSTGQTDRQTDRQTDGRTRYRYTDPVPHTTWIASIFILLKSQVTLYVMRAGHLPLFRAHVPRKSPPQTSARCTCTYPNTNRGVVVFVITVFRGGGRCLGDKCKITSGVSAYACVEIR